MIGRGLLGRWGPNHAADPIVTRFVFSLNKYIIRILHSMYIILTMFLNEMMLSKNILVLLLVLG